MDTVQLNGHVAGTQGCLAVWPTWMRLATLECLKIHLIHQPVLIRTIQPQWALKEHVCIWTRPRISKEHCCAMQLYKTERKVGDLVVYHRGNQVGGTVWPTAPRIIDSDPRRRAWLLHEGVPALVAENKVTSADKAETLAYPLLHNIPVLPEGIVLGPHQQKYLRAAGNVPWSCCSRKRSWTELWNGRHLGAFGVWAVPTWMTPALPIWTRGRMQPMQSSTASRKGHSAIAVIVFPKMMISQFMRTCETIFGTRLQVMDETGRWMNPCPRRNWLHFEVSLEDWHGRADMKGQILCTARMNFNDVAIPKVLSKVWRMLIELSNLPCREMTSKSLQDRLGWLERPRGRYLFWRQLREWGWVQESARTPLYTSRHGMMWNWVSTNFTWLCLDRRPWNECVEPSCRLRYIYIYAIQGSVGSGDKLRALLCGLTGNFESVKDAGLVWTERAMLHLYFTGCRSLSDHLFCEAARCRTNPWE